MQACLAGAIREKGMAAVFARRASVSCARQLESHALWTNGTNGKHHVHTATHLYVQVDEVSEASIQGQGSCSGGDVEDEERVHPVILVLLLTGLAFVFDPGEEHLFCVFVSEICDIIVVPGGRVSCLS